MRTLAASLVLVSFTAFAADAPPDKAKEVLAGMSKFYAAATSFQAHVDSNFKSEMRGMKGEMKSTYDLSFQRPNLLALVKGEGMMGGSIYSDGTNLVSYLPMLKKYTSGKAPAQAGDIFDPMTEALIMQGLPIGVAPLLAADPLKALLSNASAVEYVGTSEVNGIATHQVRLQIAPMVADYWIAAGDKPLLVKYESALDVSKMPAGAGQEMQITEARRTSTFSNWKINEPVDASVFRFSPPAEAQLVQEFFPRNKDEEPAPLSGKPAPDFTLTDLAGQEVTLASLKGKVVVLDFWATWCPPCVKALPIVAETVASFKDRGVVFYAVNAREDKAKIEAFLQSKSLDIPVLLDRDGGVMKLYGVSSIPQTFIVDQEGIVRSIHRGFSPQLGERLTGELDALVKGGKIPSSAAE